MHIKIIIEAFEKASKELENRGEINPSKTKISKFLETFFDNEIKFSYSFRSFSDLKTTIDNGNKEVIVKQVEVLDGLSFYLNYDNYEDYVFKNKLRTINGDIHKDTKISILEEKARKYKASMNQRISVASKVVLSIIAIIMVVYIINSIINQQRWMVWQEDRYVEVKFNTEKYDIGQLRLYKKDKIELFRKVTLQCDAVFFNDNGTVNFWYGKNNKKELEYFTFLGLHPQTGKTLKPITEHMIKTHICNIPKK